MRVFSSCIILYICETPINKLITEEWCTKVPQILLSNVLYIYLLSEKLALSSPLGRYMLSMGRVYFKLAVTTWFVYLDVYMSF